MDLYLNAAVAVIGVAGAAGFFWAVFRTKGTSTTIDLLEQSVRIERTERQALERRCTEERVHLQGQIDILTAQFSSQIAKAVVAIVREEIRYERGAP